MFEKMKVFMGKVHLVFRVHVTALELNRWNVVLLWFRGKKVLTNDHDFPLVRKRNRGPSPYLPTHFLLLLCCLTSDILKML